MRRDSPRYGNFPKRRKSRESPWNRASPAFGKLWEHAGKCRVDLGINILDFVENLDCEEIDALNEEGLLNNNIGLKSDINGKEIHFELKNERGDILKKTIPEGELQKYIVAYEMIRCDGHGMKKERRRCSSCQNFKPIEGCAKGNCTARGDVVQRSRIICAFDYVPNKNECFNEDIS